MIEGPGKKKKSSKKMATVSFELQMLNEITKIAKSVDGTMSEISKGWKNLDESSSSSSERNEENPEEETKKPVARKREIKAQEKAGKSLKKSQNTGTGTWS